MTAPTLHLRRPRPGARTALSWILFGAFLIALAAARPLGSGLNPNGLTAVAEIITSAFSPDLTPAFLATALGDAVVTVAFAVAAMSVALAFGLPAAVVASGVLDPKPGRRRIVTASIRALLALVRSMHELVWALLFVAVLGLTPWAGILAIGIPYAGAVGRVMAERLQDTPAEPRRALDAAGASPLQQLWYARVPAVAADAVGYLSYRFECAIRSAAVLSFIGLGGIGFRIEIALADLDFDQVWTLIYLLVAVIAAVDWGTARVRRRIVG